MSAGGLSAIVGVLALFGVVVVAAIVRGLRKRT